MNECAWKALPCRARGTTTRRNAQHQAELLESLVDTWNKDCKVIWFNRVRTCVDRENVHRCRMQHCSFHLNFHSKLRLLKSTSMHWEFTDIDPMHCPQTSAIAQQRYPQVEHKLGQWYRSPNWHKTLPVNRERLLKHKCCWIRCKSNVPLFRDSVQTFRHGSNKHITSFISLPHRMFRAG
jgi:hypothetical protein